MNQPPPFYPPPPSPEEMAEMQQRHRVAELEAHLLQQAAERRALFESEFYKADLWKNACIAALQGVNMGLANPGAVEGAIKAADSVLEAFRKRFYRTDVAPVVSIATREAREP